MFVNCPLCRGLVATDPATDLPPERCPRCAAELRGMDNAHAAADDARSGVAAAIAEAFGGPAEEVVGPSADPAGKPAISIAHLLKVEPETHAGPAAEGDSAAEGRPPARDPAVQPAPAPAPAAAGAPTPTPAPALAPDTDHTPKPGAESGPESTPRAEVPGVSSQGAPPAPARSPGGRPAPSFARRRRAGASDASGRWPLPTAIATLALLLCMQWLLADRARLAADPGWRPMLVRTCAVLRCSLPPWREPTAIALLERDVRPHPAAGGALRITASFRNDAAWAQPWPEVVLTLSDIDGRPLGTRAFTVSEYLGGEPPSPLLASGEGAVIRMDVVEPGPGAVGFSFDFR
jgi:hypothetical protein